MGALALNQLLESAQDKGVDIELETSALENHVSNVQTKTLISLFLNYHFRAYWMQ